jgi:hypothetical protein
MQVHVPKAPHEKFCGVVHKYYIVITEAPCLGHCLCDGRHLGRRPLPVTAAYNARPLSATANGRRHRHRPLSVTAAAIAAARFL